MNKIFGFILSLMFSGSLMAIDCSNNPREMSMNEPLTVVLSEKHWTRLSFPESALKGLEPMQKNGLKIDPVGGSRFKNHIVLKSTNPDYTSKMVVFGLSGREYIVNLVSSDCGDSRVKVTTSLDKKETKRKSSNDKSYRFLATYLALEGKAPPGYKEFKFSSPMSERKVMQQGSVEFYVATQYIGPKYIGTVFEVVNNGRASFKVSIDTIDYENRNIIKAIGDVHHIAMLPMDRTLKARPKTSEINHLNANQHRGLVFVVTERKYGQ